MEIKRPHVRTIPSKYAPSQTRCLTCGKLGKRKAILHRQVRTIAYKQIVYLDVTYGEYRAGCDCCTTFRTTPSGVDPKALYDNQVRQAVLDRILDDGMSIEQVIRSMRGDFLLDLSDGFVYDCLHRQVRQLDLSDHRRWVLERVSGTLCIDELDLGRSPCCWPPTRSKISPWPSPWSAATTTTTCAGSSRTSRTGAWKSR